MTLYRPVIIAEIAKNHNGSLTFAKNLADLAIKAGADYVKTQAYDMATMNKAHANFDRYEYSNLEMKDLRLLKTHVESQGKRFLLSCFNKKLLIQIKELGLNEIKIPSTYAVNEPFLDEAKNLFDKVFISHGFKEGLKYFLNAPGTGKVINLFCTSLYPTKDEDICLDAFNNFYGGFSDHTEGLCAAMAIWLKRPEMCPFYLEKHFNFAYAKRSYEWDFDELKSFVYLTNRIIKMHETDPQSFINKGLELKKNFEFYRSEFPFEF